MSNQTFRNNPFRSIRPLVTLGIAILLTSSVLYFFLVRNEHYSLAWVIVAGVWLLLIIDLYYFKICDTELVIKHFLFPGDVKRVQIKNIKELVITRPQKSSVGLRVLTTDGRRRFYSACSLSSVTWKRFMRAMERKGVVIKNEAIVCFFFYLCDSEII